MQLSHRITHIAGEEGDGWEIYFKTQELKAAGIAVTDLTIGEHDTRTDPDIVTAMSHAAQQGATGYAAIPGIPELRAAIADRVAARTGVATTAENVLIFPGGQAALFAAHMAVLDPGDRAAFIDPYYATYPGTIRAAGGVPVPIQTGPRDAFRPTAQALAGAAGARSLLVNSPNNPTGAVYDRATLETIRQAVLAQDIWLISDEVYDTQIWEGAHLSPRALPDMAERTLVIGSFSKSHAMTGSRVGWMIGPSKAMSALMQLPLHTTFGIPGYIQKAALHALGKGDRFEAQIAAPFARRRQLAQDVFAGHSHVRMVPSQGAMYFLLDIRDTGLSGRDFAFALLKARNIAVMPGESFGAAAAGHLRIAMTIDDDRFVDALHQIADFIREVTP
ncbi:pyridoxal phosphate-dependent aminotransferase [Aliiroseovarius sp. PTFE2010]|uniref:pyridoxal phosphate-dependent aminotransferase n=1 Tax=Aliiroseovarius sp. PTFE2010 TaxID=3417190 RepID=UPI003CEE8AAA